ncbi:hypothetical protein GCM10010451_44950 [Streptomyces virens]|uniref:Uncharacterized protein n=2 Tax=Streptomyces TaxID=1883 RepID=A0AA40VFS6_9ACTN|nr:MULTISPECIES: DUF6243 family protein [Streptomyces]MBA8943038.1 hypothetical protein [Streptomyces calvus]MBA8978734.1 hypothetical protein [Streptomyces calvus]GGP34784.1 hypothetical protein GCM10010247_03060 [Streptomyces calvus]
MARGGAGNMLGVGGTRQHLGRDALRGGGRAGRVGGGLDPQAQKRELLRRLQEERRHTAQDGQRRQEADEGTETETETEAETGKSEGSRRG